MIEAKHSIYGFQSNSILYVQLVRGNLTTFVSRVRDNFAEETLGRDTKRIADTNIYFCYPARSQSGTGWE
jgi:hypothetical protein